jgi:hypothetical protein
MNQEQLIGGAMPDPESVDEQTKAEDERESRAEHRADRDPTEEETQAADHAREEFAKEASDVAEHFDEAAKRGTSAKGEGRIE